MKLHRFIGPYNLKTGKLEITDKELANQLKNVLRVEIGESVILGDGTMNEAEATLTSIAKDKIEFEIHAIGKSKSESDRNVTLYAAILKGEHFEIVVEKATETGVTKIQPIITDRTVKTGLRIERLQKIVKEAAEQSGRGIVPEVGSPILFSEAIVEVKKFNTVLFFDSSGKQINKLTSMSHVTKPHVAIFVGPEGGWSENEIVAAKKAKFDFVSLGSLTLRAETAAIVGSYLVTHDLLN